MKPSAVYLTCVALSLLAAVSRAPAADYQNPFGLHGPQYSHWLEGNHANLWLEAEARFAVLAESNAGWARQDFWWGTVEPQRGTFEWEAFDRAMEAYQRHDLNLLAILCYSSAWSDGVCPDTDQERALFGNYVYQMVQRYKDHVGAWEIWNEPNIQPFWSPRPDPELYTKLLKVAYTSAKKADPDCVIVGGVFAGPDSAFLEGMYQHGAQGHFDVLSYHNYGQELDITTEWADLEKLRQVMRKYGDGGKPVWHTENGFYTGPVGLSETDQAARVVRFSVGLLAAGIERTFQLTLPDWTDDPQHHDLSVYRGLTRSDYRIKESYPAYQTMCRRLADKNFLGALRPAPGVSGFLFGNDAGQTVAVLWRDWKEVAAATTVRADVPVLLVQQMDGNWRRHRSESGVYNLAVGRNPVYILNPGPALANQRLVRWPNPVLSSLSRVRDAALTADVTNPANSPLELRVAPTRRQVTAIAPTAIEPGADAAVKVAVDASRLDVGLHEFFWTLSPAGGGQPLAQGYRLVEIEAPLRLSFDRFNSLSSDSPTLPARIEYRGAVPASGTLALQLNGQPSGAPVAVDLLPGDSTAVPLPLNLAAFESGRSVPIEVVLESQGLTLSTACTRPLIHCPQAPKEARIDGRLDEWTGGTAQIKPSQLRWEYVNAVEKPGPEDLAVTGWLAYDDRGLWVALRVTDDVLSIPRTRAIWNWDSLQVGLDLGSDAGPDDTYDGNDLEVELGYRQDAAPWCYLGSCPIGWPAKQLSEQLVAAVKPGDEPGVLNYELLIPASLLVSSTSLESGTVIGFSLLVNDNDGTGRAGWQELTPGIGMGKSPSHFAWLWFR